MAASSVSRIELGARSSAVADGMPAIAIDVRREVDVGLAITREENRVVVAGHPDAVGILAWNIRQLGDPDSPFGGHIHIEFYPDHPYLRSDSLPAVFELGGA
jgi:hypothetical protein